MTAVTKTGDWRRARALLAAGPLRLRAAIGLALRQEAEALRREIVQGLTRQAPGGSPLAPPKETTLAARRLKGFGGSKSLIVRADLRNGIATIVRGDEAFVGVPRTARGKDGQSLANVAEIQEFGSAPIVIPMTDAMRRFVFAVLREAGEPIGAGGGGGAGVVVVRLIVATLELPALVVDTVAAVTAAQRPALVNRDPGPDEVAVPIDATVALELVDAGPDGIDRAATRVWVDGVLAFDGGAAPELQPGFDGPAAEVIEGADTLRVVLHPATFFASEALVAVHVVSATLGGAHTLDQTYRFRVEDRTAPRLVGGQATGQRTVELGFDEAVRVIDPAGFSLSPRDFPAVPADVVAAEADGARVRLTLHTELTPDVRYEVVAAGVADLSGNAVLAPFDRATVRGFLPPRPEARRFDLWAMLPKHNRREDLTGDLWRFIACLQEVTDLLLADVDRFPEVFDLERAPEVFLDLILADLGNPFPFDLDELGKRRLASVLVEMYRQKGTARGIINAVRFFLGVEIEAVTAYAGEALVLGESELGVDWILGPSNRFARYAFDVVVGVPLTDAQRKQLRAIVEYLKPAHTHFVTLVEPAPPAFIDHWELGVSEVGVSTDLH